MRTGRVAVEHLSDEGMDGLGGAEFPLPPVVFLGAAGLLDGLGTSWHSILTFFSIVDGQGVVTFLNRIKDVIEQPLRMLVEI